MFCMGSNRQQRKPYCNWSSARCRRCCDAFLGGLACAQRLSSSLVRGVAQFLASHVQLSSTNDDMDATKQPHHQCDAAAKDVRPAILHHECIVQLTKEHAQPVTIDDGLPVTGSYAGDCKSKNPCIHGLCITQTRRNGTMARPESQHILWPSLTLLITMHWKGEVWTMFPMSTSMYSQSPWKG